LAGLPHQPTDVPVSDPLVTNDRQVKVTFASPKPSNNGSPIISYQLVMDDGKTGNFIDIGGFYSNSMLTQYTVTQNITKGRYQRFMYRAKNAVGWGPFSAVSSVLSATVPSAPKAPSFLTFANLTLSIVVPRSTSDGGDTITNYELWVDAGDDFTSSFTKLVGYSNNAMVYLATQQVDGLVLGKTYRFISRSKNPIDYSAYSPYGYIAFGDVPTTMSRPLITASSETSLSVVWTAPAASTLTIKGYILNMDNGDDTDPVPIYIGVNRPDILNFEVGGLITGLPYRLTVQASNVNGLSLQSPVSSFYACSPPSNMQTPYYISSS